jgi:hypothetical protein
MRAIVICVAALVLAAPAAAGGVATAGVGPPNDGLGAGDTWNAEVTIKQHGVTPLVGLKPKVIITNATGVRKEFAAAPTDRAGVYVAKVQFPSDGEWNYAVYDGFTTYGHAQTHTFAPVQIGPGGGSGFSLPVWPALVAGAIAEVAAALLLARRLRPVPAPAAQQ